MVYKIIYCCYIDYYIKPIIENYIKNEVSGYSNVTTRFTVIDALKMLMTHIDETCYGSGVSDDQTK